MTLAEFDRLTARDFENGAVRGELRATFRVVSELRDLLAEARAEIAAAIDALDGSVGLPDPPVKELHRKLSEAFAYFAKTERERKEVRAELERVKDERDQARIMAAFPPADDATIREWKGRANQLLSVEGELAKQVKLRDQWYTDCKAAEARAEQLAEELMVMELRAQSAEAGWKAALARKED